MPSRSNLSFAAPAYNPDPTFQTALDQASTPGLTLTQRFHRLLESVDIPNLTHAPQGLSSQLTDAHTKMLALQVFKQTPHYQSFKNCVARTLTELDRIANSSRPANQHNTNFQNLGDGLWETVTLNSTSRFGAFQADLYQQACPDANRLVRMHTFAQQLPHLVAGGGEDNARACIKDLSERLDVCGPGLVQYFDEAVNSVRQTTFCKPVRTPADLFECMPLLSNALIWSPMTGPTAPAPVFQICHKGLMCVPMELFSISTKR